MIRLEPVAPHHAPMLQPLLEDPAVAATTPFPHPYPADGAPDYVAGLIAGRTAGTRHDFAICDGEGRAAGVVLVKDIDRERGEAELGYWVGVPFWGKGLASAAGALAVAFAFGELGLSSLKAVCLESNTASLRVLAKLGFVPVGTEMWAQAKWPEPRRSAVLRLTREAWEARQDAGGR